MVIKVINSVIQNIMFMSFLSYRQLRMKKMSMMKDSTNYCSV